MTVEFWFRDEKKATAVCTDGVTIHWSGPGAGEVEDIADFYSRDSLGGKQLLELMVGRMRGHWHAYVISSDPD